MDDENKLVPVEQHTIEFHGDELQAVRMANGEIYVAIKPICEYIGLAWQPQHRKLKNDPILSTKTMSITLTVTDIDPNSKRPHSSEMIGLRLEFVNGWLFKIDQVNRKPAAPRPLSQSLHLTVYSPPQCVQLCYEL